MSALRSQQQAFRRAVVDEPATDLFAAGSSDPQRRLEIYRHAYRSRLTDALAANYPVLARALGDQAFARLALQYIDARPSRHASIRWFGDQLGAFCDECGELRGDLLPHPALRDLIRLEWAICGAFDAADAPLATRADLMPLAPAAWPALRLRFHPSVEMLELGWCVEPIWQALSRDIDDGLERDVPEPRANRHAIVVWRQQLTPKWRSLDAVEAVCLAAALRGERFGQCCELAANRLADFDAPAAMAGWLQGWLAEGLIARD
jgi:hypothetical protein